MLRVYNENKTTKIHFQGLIKTTIRYISYLGSLPPMTDVFVAASPHPSHLDHSLLMKQVALSHESTTPLRQLGERTLALGGTPVRVCEEYKV